MAIKVQGTTVVDDSRNAEVVTLSIDGTPVTATPTELNILDGATVTTAELNILDGATVTTAELNKLDGVTVTTDELNILGGATVTTDELNKLDGVTVTTDELNILDGATVTTDELNILDGATVTTAELNKLDGATVTTAELNKLDGATVTTAELNILDGATVTTAELNILDGATVTTAELNILDGVTATTNELNILSGTNVTTEELDFLSGVTSDVQTQIDNKVNLTSSTGSAILPAGTTAERDASPAAGYLRFNSDMGSFEGYDGTEWGAIGGADAELVATGSIPGAGTPVMLRSDGTVEVVGLSPVAEDVGSETVFNSAFTQYISATYDPAAGKVVIAYRDGGNSSYGTAVVGTVSGSSISFGSPTVFNSGNTTQISAVYDSATGKVVIAYQDRGNSDYGTAVVGTVSGDSISFGSSTVFHSAVTQYISTTFDSTAGKVVIAYQDDPNSDNGTAIVGTVSGSSISFGSSTVFNAAITEYISATYDSAAGKVVIAYQDRGNSFYGTAIVGTVSGSSISFGSPTVFESGSTDDISAVYDSTAGKVVIAYNDSGSNGTAIVGTVSGDSISFGSKTYFKFDDTGGISATYDPAAGKVVIAYRDGGNSFYGTAIVGTVSGSSISFGSSFVFNSSYTEDMSAAYDSAAGKVVIAYRDNGNSDRGTAITYNPAYTGTNANDFVGFAQDAASNGDTVLVATNQQIDANQTGLTPKSTYYVDTDGTLTTSDTGYPVAGFALDANTIRTGG